VDLSREVERMPAEEPIMIAGVRIPAIGANSLEASAPVKVEVALAHLGLAP
jgi:hypothetical protein